MPTLSGIQLGHKTRLTCVSNKNNNKHGKYEMGYDWLWSTLEN